MATSLAATTARRAAALARLSPSPAGAVSLVPRRGLSGAAESRRPPKISIWHKDAYPMFSEFVPVLKVFAFIHGFYNCAKMKTEKEENVAEPAK